MCWFLLVCNTLAFSPPRVSVETLVSQFTRFSASYEEGYRRALSLYQQDGFVILRQAFKHTLIEEMRYTVMRYIERRGQLVNTHAFGDRGGWYIAEFPNEELLRQVVLDPIASNAPLRSLLRHIHGVEPRILHRSEIYVDNAAGWHFDGTVGTRAAILAQRQRVPQQCQDRFLFPYPIDETGRTPDVSASYSDPVDGGLDAMYQRAGRSPSVTLHPALGDVVVFNQHVHHRGQLRKYSNGGRKLYPGFGKHRAVISVTFARDNAFARHWDNAFALRSSIVNGKTACGTFNYRKRQVNFSDECVCAAFDELLAQRPLAIERAGMPTRMHEAAQRWRTTPGHLWEGTPMPVQATVAASAIESGTAIVTGGCGAIGAEITAGLARAGLDVVVAARPGSEAKCGNATRLLWARRRVAKDRRLWIEAVDLESLPSVHAFVTRLIEQYVDARPRVLVNAAAVGVSSRRVTSSGLEVTFQIRRRAANFSKSLAYRQSKAAMRMLSNCAAAQEDAERGGGGGGSVFYNAVHPGDVGGTKMHKTRGHDSPRAGAERSIWLAVHAPRLGLQGTYWEMVWYPQNKTSASEQRARNFDDPNLMHTLWQYCDSVYHCLATRPERLSEGQAMKLCGS